jgi:ubiquinone/menaquinone biosynthesis C-methylase UbiE
MHKEDFEYLYNLEETLWWFVGMRRITSALLDLEAQFPEDKMILDAGCGTGGMLSWLKRYVGEGKVFGIDLVEDALVFCRRRHHQNTAQASVTSLPFADCVFDLVTSFDVLVQLPGMQMDEIAIGEMYRVLRPRGLVFVRVAAYNWMRSGHDKALGSQRRYSIKQLTRKVEKAGFQILRATYANSFLLPIAVARRLLLKKIGLVDSGSDVKPFSKNFQFLNKAFTNILKKEAVILQNPAASLRAGLSIICLARKVENDADQIYK